jgi:hypothetical protein
MKMNEKGKKVLESLIYEELKKKKNIFRKNQTETSSIITVVNIWFHIFGPLRLVPFIITITV